jgi:hypothetical protein
VGVVDADVVLLTCGNGRDSGIPRMRSVALPPRPGRHELDPVLAMRPRRLVVAGTDADLAAVLLRLLRTDRLAVELAYLPARRSSAAARVWGLPQGGPARDLAVQGRAAAVPLVRDDSGGVLVGCGELRSVRGEVYCDEVLTLRGSAPRLVVTPWQPGGVAVRAGRWGGLPDGSRRPVPQATRAGRGSGAGRAVQVGCLPATLTVDGVLHPRPVTRWAWYRHTDDWRLVRP